MSKDKYSYTHSSDFVSSIASMIQVARAGLELPTCLKTALCKIVGSQGANYPVFTFAVVRHYWDVPSIRVQKKIRTAKHALLTQNLRNYETLSCFRIVLKHIVGRVKTDVLQKRI